MIGAIHFLLVFTILPGAGMEADPDERIRGHAWLDPDSRENPLRICRNNW